MLQPAPGSRRRATIVALALAFANPAHAEQPIAADSPAVRQADNRPLPAPPPPSDVATGTEFRERFVLETGRIEVSEPPPDVLRMQIHGEYQVRYTRLTDLPLRPFGTVAGTSSLGQTNRVYHWLRLTPRLHVGETLEVAAQLDVPRGFFIGEETRFVGTARDSFDKRQPLRLEPRWLYVEWSPPFGVLRVGQEPSHWGMGIVENDGDHPTLFGDYFGGTIVERVLFVTRPAGARSPFNVAVAGDLVFEDHLADIRDEQVALRGVVSLFYEDRSRNMVGFYGVYRDQRQTGEGALGTEIDQDLRIFVLDSAGRFNAKIPGGRGHVFGQYEVAYTFGSTNIFQTIEQATRDAREDVQSAGAAVELGAVLTRGSGDDRWGELVAAIEWGWASGDSDPTDGTSERFTMDPNHNVGLILFDEVLKWKTARAADQAGDTAIVNGGAPGRELLPSDGGIFSATYLYPTLVYRPTPALDLKAGVVLAQSTADFVDPVAFMTDGRLVNYDDGPASRRDLGVELDAGVEYRVALEHGMTAELGAQGGVLFPGGAFDDASGNDLGTQAIGVARFGLEY